LQSILYNISMNKQLIKAVIAEKQQEIGTAKLLQRGECFDKNSNYVLIGIRRAGKSFTLYQNIQELISAGIATIEDILYVNFEDERVASIRADELGDILDAYKEMYHQERPYIFLDEIQNITGWEKFARRLAESKYHVMITGS